MGGIAIDLTDRRALVTGGGRGIGAAICRYLVAAGATVAVNCGSSCEQAERLAAALNDAAGRPAAIPAPGDVGDETDARRMVAEAAAGLGGLDILVNNAGVESTWPALELPLGEWDRIMQVNLRGAFVCSQEAARVMARQGTGGVIVNNSSIHDEAPRLGLAHYCVAKAGLRMLTKALALEWAELGIRVVAVSPGAIETEMNREEIEAFGRERFEEWIPLGRLGMVDDVASAVAFLASDAASYISGVTLPIDGAYPLNLVRYDPRKKDEGGGHR